MLLSLQSITDLEEFHKKLYKRIQRYFIRRGSQNTSRLLRTRHTKQFFRLGSFGATEELLFAMAVEDPG